MTKKLATRKEEEVEPIALDPTALEDLMLKGDLGRLTPAQRVQYYAATCERVGLDPIAKPFDYLTLKGKTVLYANKGCAEQLRQRHQVSLKIEHTEVVNDIYAVTVIAYAPDGRTDTDMGTVFVGRLSGSDLANAMLKAVTKAKRRVTPSLLGLGMLDELEVETIKDAKTTVADEQHKLAQSKVKPQRDTPEETQVPELEEDMNPKQKLVELMRHWRDCETVQQCYECGKQVLVLRGIATDGTASDEEITKVNDWVESKMADGETFEEVILGMKGASEKFEITDVQPKPEEDEEDPWGDE